MADISPARRNVQIEETAYRAAVSEATFTRMGASVNFINERQHDDFEYRLNGPYSIGEGDSNLDGQRPFLYNAELVGFGFANGIVGTGGTTEIDIEWYDSAGVNQGTIFTTPPTIDSTSSNNSVQLYDVVNATSITLPTGHTAPVFSKTSFLQGESLIINLTTSMTNPENLSLFLYYRPIN